MKSKMNKKDNPLHKGGPHFGMRRHRGHRRPHGPRGEGQHGPHFGMHGPHFGMHGPHFSMHGPYNDVNAYPPYPYPPHGMVNNIDNEEGYPNSNTNFK